VNKNAKKTKISIFRQKRIFFVSFTIRHYLIYLSNIFAKTLVAYDRLNLIFILNYNSLTFTVWFFFSTQ